MMIEINLELNREEKKRKKVIVYPHLHVTRTHHPRNFTPKFQKGGGKNDP